MFTLPSFSCNTILDKELVSKNIKNISDIYQGEKAEVDLLQKGFIKIMKEDAPIFNSFILVRLVNNKFVLSLFNDSCLLPKLGTFVGDETEAPAFFNKLEANTILEKVMKGA
jgi:hypothetical protein